MAQKTSRHLTLIRTVIVRSSAALVILCAVYAVAAFAGSSIPRNAGWDETDQGVEIIVETNGLHTGIVMPLVTGQKDWRPDFPASDLAESTLPYTHISVSWGAREIFLNTPEWTDLSARTALKVGTIGDPGLLHVAHYIRPAAGENYRIVRLRPAEYTRLVKDIEAHIYLSGSERKSYPGYGRADVFYDAPGRYSPLLTCNQWTSNRLASAGVRVGLWSPFSGGVMKWFPAS
ncbi:MAG: DUF2459 domain-containing protein [Sphingomonadaceae bacterium]